MDMQVNLSLDAALQNQSNETGAGGGSGSRSQAFDSTMGIRVQLQHAAGGNLQEYSPNHEGRVSIRVCSRLNYRLRITGHDIQEITTDSLAPGLGDRIVEITLHLKNADHGPKSNEGTISAKRLQIPRNAQKELEKGNSALAKGDLEVARQSFEKAVSLYPDFDQAYNNLGVTLMQAGDRDGGKAAFEKAVAVNDHFARAYVNLAKIAFDAKDYSKADELSRKALKTEPLNPSSLFLVIESSFFLGAFDQAVTYTKTLHSLPHSNLGLAHYLSAKSLEAQRMPREAVVQYQLFIQESPSDPNVPKALEAISRLQASMPQ